jgi:hypothetical protein
LLHKYATGRLKEIHVADRIFFTASSFHVAHWRQRVPFPMPTSHRTVHTGADANACLKEGRRVPTIQRTSLGAFGGCQEILRDPRIGVLRGRFRPAQGQHRDPLVSSASVEGAVFTQDTH